MALGNKVEELQQSVAILRERMDNDRGQLDKTVQTQQKTADRLTELQRNHDRELALLKREVEELRKWKEEFSRRLWAFGPTY